MLRTAVLVAVAALVAVSCGGGDTADGEASIDGLARAGGEATVFDTSRNAFAQGIATLTVEQRRAFAVGNNFFNDNWVTAPASTTARDGLGPTFNAQSCSSCHVADGRAQPPIDADDPERGLLLRLSVIGPDGLPIPDPAYGGQLQDRSINGVPAEGTIVITTTEIVGSFDDGTTYRLAAPAYAIGSPAFGEPSSELMISPRIAPAIFGVGLLEAIPQESIVARSDPDDDDGDGISGRPNMVLDPEGGTTLGRFGWKATVPTLEVQSGFAFSADIGITSTGFPELDCPAPQTECRDAIDGGDPEIEDDTFGRVSFYTRTLAVPARRDVAATETMAGEDTFSSIGCAGCHVPSSRTGDSPIVALADQEIRPYTDLLLHDMGAGLADGRPDGQATGTEWRTPPLWGIGLTDTVSGHTRFLHDGRARDLTEAILWHGGEALSAQRAFLALPVGDRADLLAFLESL